MYNIYIYIIYKSANVVPSSFCRISSTFVKMCNSHSIAKNELGFSTAHLKLHPLNLSNKW